VYHCIKKKWGKTPEQTLHRENTNTQTRTQENPTQPEQGQSVCQLADTPTLTTKKLSHTALSLEEGNPLSSSQEPQKSFLPGQPNGFWAFFVFIFLIFVSPVLFRFRHNNQLHALMEFFDQSQKNFFSHHKSKSESDGCTPRCMYMPYKYLCWSNTPKT
jgi:hypothetical protein